MLAESSGSLLDNIELINALDQSKTTWEEVNESLRVSEQTAKDIEQVRDYLIIASLQSLRLYNLRKIPYKL